MGLFIKTSYIYDACFIYLQNEIRRVSDPPECMPISKPFSEDFGNDAI